MPMLTNWKEKVTFHVDSSRRPLIVVVGPTASGKTAFSLAIAKHLGRNAEIINADARQLYRSMDIGTAKIRPEEMQTVVHHLLDVLDPSEEATAAWYKAEATRVINDVVDRGNVPILVGGSMLYISALIDDLQFAPGANAAVRKRLENEYDVDEGTGLYTRLMEIDPETASAFSVRNKPYVVRAMEIF